MTLADGENFDITGRRELDEECRATPAVSKAFSPDEKQAFVHDYLTELGHSTSPILPISWPAIPAKVVLYLIAAHHPAFS